MSISETVSPSPRWSGSNGVPAVERAVAILGYLSAEENAPATMTQIANALGLNGSTCFNILRTLVEARFLSYEPSTKTYELGLALPELANAVHASEQILRIAIEHSQQLARETSQTCLLFRWTADEDFVVVHKVEGSGKFKLTTSIGERFPPNSSVLSKALLAWEPAEVVERFIERYGLMARTPQAITNQARFRRELAAVRHHGYAVSIGEYYPDHNGMSAPIFDGAGQVSYVLVISGFAFELAPHVIQRIGPILVSTTEQITSTIGGIKPEGER